MRHAVFAVALLLPAAVGAQGISSPSSTEIAVQVTIATPARVPRTAVEAGMIKSAPIYENVPGLIRKYFTIGQNNFGGMYLFKDRASAQAWFSDAWRAKAAATYGSQPSVTYYDVPLAVDNSGSK